MRRLFNMMSDQVQATAGQLPGWWAKLSPDPRTWAPFTWVLAGLVLVVLLALMIRPRRRAGARRPELLISHGELRVAAWAAPKVVSSLRAPASAAYELAMTVSNLSASPVQLLELAVRTNDASAATAAEVAAVLPPHGAVDVTADLREAGGDEGVLDLFVYVPDMPPKTFRVRAKLLWEPWNARYRVLPLDQRVDVARGFSERTQRRRQAAAPRRRSQPAAPATTERRPGGPFGDEGRFEPRPEFTRPRDAAPRSGGAQERAAAPAEERPQADVGRPARAGAPAREPGGERALVDEVGSFDEPEPEPTWPAARPQRQEHRAQVPRPPQRGPGAAPGAAPGADDGGGADEGVAWRIGDAERGSERSGLGRAARAARGTDRDGAQAADSGTGRRARRAESERPRRWAVREDAAADASAPIPDLGPAELVGPDEEAPERRRPAPAPAAARGGSAPRGEETRSEPPAGGRPAGGRPAGERPAGEGAAGARAGAERAGGERAGAERAGGERAREERVVDEGDGGDRRGGVAAESDRSDDEERQERPRPRLEFPDEF